MNTTIAIPEKLYQFAREYMDDHYCLELLQFFGAHPRTRFSKLAVTHALNVSGERLYIEKALKCLVEKGAIAVVTENNTVFYSLTDDETLNSLALAFAKLGWGQWQTMLSKPVANVNKYNTISVIATCDGCTN